jgi:hypothetical protein
VTDGAAERFAASIAEIDAANSEDPTRMEFEGVSHPKELLHSRLMTEWVRRLDPEADEAQLLAARAHHFRRWTLPRSDYAEGRAGYLRWRTDASKQHASEVGGILRRRGYGDDVVDRVTSIIRKLDRASDPAVQTHEDALCLVFVQTQMEDVTRRLGEDAMVAVVAKTLRKMSPRAIDLALEMTEGDDRRRLLLAAAALAGSGSD